MELRKWNIGITASGKFLLLLQGELVQERNINIGELVEFEVSGDKIEGV